jgi:hypothetical protein
VKSPQIRLDWVCDLLKSDGNEAKLLIRDSLTHLFKNVCGSLRKGLLNETSEISGTMENLSWLNNFEDAITQKQKLWYENLHKYIYLYIYNLLL